MSGYKRVKWLFGKEIRIPEEWEVSKIESVGDIIGGGTPDSTNPKYWYGDILWAVPTDITKLSTSYINDTERKITKVGLENSSAKLLPAGTVLITSRATIGKCAIATKPIATNQGFQNIICNDNFDRLFIFYMIKHDSNKLLRLSYGTTFLEISKAAIKSIAILAPKKDEQTKIASILSGVDALIGSTQQTIKKTERLKKGLMQDLLTRGIGHTKFKKVKGLFGKEIEIPEEWECVSLNDLCDEIYRYPTYYNIEYVSTGIPEIRGELIKQNGSLVTNLSKYRFLSKETSSRFPKTQLVDGDFVFSVRGTMGKVALITKNFQGANITANLMRISPNQKKVVSKLLLFHFLTKSFSDVLESLSPQTTIKTIQSKDLKSIKFIIPKLSTEQQRIASILSGVDAYIQKNQQYREKLKKLKKGLMQKLLTGQIQVKI